MGVVKNWLLPQGCLWLLIPDLVAALAEVALVVRPGRLTRFDHLVPLVVAHPGFSGFESSLFDLLLNDTLPVALGQVPLRAGLFIWW